jgi:ERF superfamily
VKNLAAALVAAQQSFPAIPKDAVNPHFKNRFASLHTIVEKALPVLNENGLALMQFPTIAEGQPALRTKLIHAESGESEEDTMLLSAVKNDPQGQGSALTYARRYAVLSILGLVADEDDDGAAASKPAAKKAAPANGVASEAVQKRIHAIIGELAEQRGVERQQVHDALKGALGIESMANLSAENAAKADGILAGWQKKVGVA